MAACCQPTITHVNSPSSFSDMAQDTRFSFFDYADLDSRTCQQLESVLSATSKPIVELPWLDVLTVSSEAENINDTERDARAQHQPVTEQVVLSAAQPVVQNERVQNEPTQPHIQVSSGYQLANTTVVCIPAPYFHAPPMAHMAMLPGGMLQSHGAVYHRYAQPPPHPLVFPLTHTHGVYYSVMPPPQSHPLPSHLATPLPAALCSHMQHMSPPQLHGMETMPLVPPPSVASSAMVIASLPVVSAQDSIGQCLPINNCHQYVSKDNVVYGANASDSNLDAHAKNNADNQISNNMEAVREWVVNSSAQQQQQQQQQQFNRVVTVEESNGAQTRDEHVSVPATSSHDDVNETNNNVKGVSGGVCADDQVMTPVINTKSIESEKEIILSEDRNDIGNAAAISIKPAAAVVAVDINAAADVAVVNGNVEASSPSSADIDTTGKSLSSPDEVFVNGGSVVRSLASASSTTSVSEVNPVVQEVRQSTDLAAAKVTPKAKVTSWASLLQNTQTATNAIVIQMPERLNSPAASERAARSGDSKSSTSGNTAKENSVTTTPELCMDSSTEQRARKELSELVMNYKLCHKSVALQPRGLTNRTNWCYVNATLQALLACPPFYHLMKQLSTSSQQPLPSGFWELNKMPVIKSMVEFISDFSTVHVRAVERQSALNSKGTVKQDIKCGAPFEPVDVYKMLQAIDYEAFKQGQQEDAEEFLSCILNRLHDEMIAATKWQDNNSDGANPNIKSEGVSLSNGSHGNGVAGDRMTADSNNADINDDTRWEQVKSKNRTVYNSSANDESSPISAIFKGQLCCFLHQLGQKESATLEPFFTLQLDIQNDSVTSVHDALEQLVSKESLQGYTCTKSKIEVDATRRVLIEELPPVLVLHLKWFTYNKSGGLQKCMKQVDFDIDLELSKDLLTSSAKSKNMVNHRKYKLFAAVSHIGARAVGGHYTADVFHPGYQCWLRCDDNNIVSVPASSVTKFSAPRVPYLIFYRRLDLS